MHPYTLSDGRVIMVKNTMADGTECDDLTGRVIPYNEKFAIVYDLWAKAQIRNAKEQDRIERELKAQSEKTQPLS